MFEEESSFFILIKKISRSTPARDDELVLHHSSNNHQKVCYQISILHWQRCTIQYGACDIQSHHQTCQVNALVDGDWIPLAHPDVIALIEMLGPLPTMAHIHVKLFEGHHVSDVDSVKKGKIIQDSSDQQGYPQEDSLSTINKSNLTTKISPLSTRHDFSSIGTT